MPAHFVYANPKVRADAGKVAIKKGPLVYCAEQVDNGENLSSIMVDITKPINEYWDDNVLGGITVIKAHGKTVKHPEKYDNKELYLDTPAELEYKEITFVPYANWGNRGAGEMYTWLRRFC